MNDKGVCRAWDWEHIRIRVGYLFSQTHLLGKLSEFHMHNRHPLGCIKHMGDCTGVSGRWKPLFREGKTRILHTA